MAKLYAKIEDQKGVSVHKIGSELDIKVYYGSSSDSRLGLHLSVIADKKDAFVLPSIYYEGKTDLKRMTIEPDYVQEALAIARE